MGAPSTDPHAGLPSSNARWDAALTGLLLAWGALLRAVHYASNRSLWHDESALALEMTGRSAHDLLFGTATTHEQTAPPGLFLSGKAATLLLGETEYALRLAPFLAALAALFVFDRVARRLLEPGARYLALALFAMAPPLVYFAGEVKQYSLDVLAGLLVLWLAISIERNRLSGAATAGLVAAGATLPWFSFPSLFFLAAAGTVLGFSALRERDRARILRLAGIAAVWLGTVVVLYLVSLRALAGNSDLQQFWSGSLAAHAGAPRVSPYMPLPPTSVQDLVWFWKTVLSVLRYPGGFSLPGLALFAAGAGVAVLARRDGRCLALLLLPLLAVLLVSGLHRYPIFGRTMLFTVPILTLLVAAGAWFVARSLAPRAPWVAAFLVGSLLVDPALSSLRGLRNPPAIAEVRSALERLAEERRAGDLLYVNSGSLRPFQFYAPRMGILEMEHVISPNSHRRWDWRLVEPDIDALRGRPRVWLLVSGTWSIDGMDEEQLLLLFADAAGRRLQEFHAPGASLYLYDFSVPSQAPAAGAAPETPPSSQDRLSWIGRHGTFWTS